MGGGTNQMMQGTAQTLGGLATGDPLSTAGGAMNAAGGANREVQNYLSRINGLSDQIYQSGLQELKGYYDLVRGTYGSPDGNVNPAHNTMIREMGAVFMQPPEGMGLATFTYDSGENGSDLITGVEIMPVEQIMQNPEYVAGIEDAMGLDLNDPDDLAVFEGASYLYESSHEEAFTLAQNYALMDIVNEVSGIMLQRANAENAQTNQNIDLGGKILGGIGIVGGLVAAPFTGGASLVATAAGAAAFAGSGMAGDAVGGALQAADVRAISQLAQAAANANGQLTPEVLELMPEDMREQIMGMYADRVNRYYNESFTEVTSRKFAEMQRNPYTDLSADPPILGQDLYMSMEGTMVEARREQETIEAIAQGGPQAAQAAMAFIKDMAEMKATEVLEEYGLQMNSTEIKWLAKLSDGQAEQEFAKMLGKGSLSPEEKEALSAIKAHGTFMAYAGRENELGFNWVTMFERYQDGQEMEIFNEVQSVQNEGIKGIFNAISAFFEGIFMGVSDGINGESRERVVDEEGQQVLTDDELVSLLQSLESIDLDDPASLGLPASVTFDITNDDHLMAAIASASPDDVLTLIGNEDVRRVLQENGVNVMAIQEQILTGQEVMDVVAMVANPDVATNFESISSESLENGMTAVTIQIAGRDPVTIELPPEEAARLVAKLEELQAAKERGREDLEAFLGANQEELSEIEEIVANLATQNIATAGSERIIPADERATDAPVQTI